MVSYALLAGLSSVRRIGRVRSWQVLQISMVESASGPWGFEGSGIEPVKPMWRPED